MKKYLVAPAATLAALLIAGPATAAPPTAADGAKLYSQRCQMCHAIAPGRPSMMAPNLFGVVGKPAASTTFSYSPALKKSGLVWTPKTLDAFLTNPSKLVPGTRMVMAVADPAQRGALIAYLSSLK